MEYRKYIFSNIIKMQQLLLDLKIDNETIGDLLIKPTKIYTQSILEVLKTEKINAMAHITGGGLTENIPRVIPNEFKAVISKISWQMPKLFSWIKSEAHLEDDELFKTFNCGIGMIAICSENDLIEVTSALKTEDCSPVVIGEIINGNGVNYSGTL